jgi:hypothetical protein
MDKTGGRLTDKVYELIHVHPLWEIQQELLVVSNRLYDMRMRHLPTLTPEKLQLLQLLLSGRPLATHQLRHSSSYPGSTRGSSGSSRKTATRQR